MKKLMIAAAIVCAAALSHGAALNWSITGIANPTDGTAVGGVAYWMDASTWDTFAAKTPDQIAAFCAGNYEYTADIKAGRPAAQASNKSGSYNPGEVISGYVVLIDKDGANYANSSVLSKDVPGSGDAPLSLTYGADTGAWQPTSAAPEPTSGLLLLLGVAGMALKRKRA